MITLRCPCGRSFKTRPESVGRIVVAPCCKAKLRISAASPQRGSSGHVADRKSAVASSYSAVSQSAPFEARNSLVETKFAPVAAKTAPVAAASQPVVSQGASVVTKCSCGQRLRVQKSAASLKVVCPKCKQTLRVGPSIPAEAYAAQTRANSEATFWSDLSSQRPTIVPAVGQQAAFVHPATNTAPAFHSAATVAPIGLAPAAATAPTAFNRFQTNQRPAGNAGGLLKWINRHRWVTVIAGLNAISLICCIFMPPALVVVVPSMVIGLVITGLLFIPRQHIVQRVTEAIGAQASGMGAGGVLLMIGLIALKVARRTRRSQNENVDYAALADPANLGALFATVAIPICIFTVFLILWRYIGMARLLAASYTAVLSCMLFLIILGGALTRVGPTYQIFNSQPSMHELGMVDAGGFPAHPHPMLHSDSQRAGPMSGPQIRITIQHRPDTDVQAIRDQFLKRLGHRNFASHGFGSTTQLMIQDTRDPQQIADLIDFGKVMSVHRLSRTILVRVR